MLRTSSWFHAQLSLLVELKGTPDHIGDPQDQLYGQPCLPPPKLSPALSQPFSAQIFQAYLAFHDLRDDNPVPYKRTLDEGGMVLTTLSPPSPTSPINMPSAGPSGLAYTSSALSPYLTTPKGPGLAMMPDTD